LRRRHSNEGFATVATQLEIELMQSILYGAETEHELNRRTSDVFDKQRTKRADMERTT
jgi:hypothetical protein